MIVYKITNTINNKCYIGITKHSFHKRYNYRNDWWNAPSVSPILQNSAKKRNGEGFVVEILEEVSTILDLLYLESYYIKYFNSLHPFGYNLTTGGDYHEPCELLRKRHSDLKKGILGKGRNAKGHKKPIKQTQKAVNTRKNKFISGELVPWNKGKKTGRPNEMAVKKSAEAHKKPIVGICCETGSVIRIASAKDAEILGFDPATISLHSNKFPKKCKHRGFWFIKEKDYNKGYLNVN